MTKEKKFYDITDKEMIAQIKTGTVKHRRCDVCGCELAMPDLGVYSREGLQTVVCESCTPTKEHHDLLAHVKDLRESHSKQEIVDILDKRMEDTWGDASIFTIEEWKEQNSEWKQIEEPRCLFCGCNIMKEFGTSGIKIGNTDTSEESEMCYDCYDKYDKKQYKIICCENCQLFRRNKCKTKDINDFCDQPERHDNTLNEWKEQTKEDD